MPRRKRICRPGSTRALRLCMPRCSGRRAGDRVDRAAEFEQHGVAGGVDQARPVAGQERQDQLATVRLQRRHGPDLVEPHHAAVADHVADDDGGEPPLFPYVSHGAADRPARTRLSSISTRIRGIGRIIVGAVSARRGTSDIVGAAAFERQRAPGRRRPAAGDAGRDAAVDLVVADMGGQAVAAEHEHVARCEQALLRSPVPARGRHRSPA